MSLPLTRRYFVVRGRVQGVGFRWFVLEAAQDLGLSGWVRNRPDGTVEGEAQGKEADVEKLLDQLRRGPRFAEVAGVDISTQAPLTGAQGFEIRR
jgi:acylphosphatase